MLAKRIIPCLDVKDNRVVKGINFLNLQDAGDPVQNAQAYDKQGADELVFLDITASSDKRKIILDLVKKVSEVLFIPYCVGGGIRSVEDMRQILSEGADKVAINTSAVETPSLITKGAEKFGSQCIVVAVDAKFNGSFHEVYIHGGRTATGIKLTDWVSKIEHLGAGEILLTSMDADGTKKGFDLTMLNKVIESVQIPVIASGGGGSISHFKDAFDTGASACLAASIFHYNEISIADLKSNLRHDGFLLR